MIFPLLPAMVTFFLFKSPHAVISSLHTASYRAPSVVSYRSIVTCYAHLLCLLQPSVVTLNMSVSIPAGYQLFLTMFIASCIDQPSKRTEQIHTQTLSTLMVLPKQPLDIWDIPYIGFIQQTPPLFFFFSLWHPEKRRIWAGSAQKDPIQWTLA